MGIGTIPLFPSRGGSLLYPMPERGEIALKESFERLVGKSGIGKDIEEKLRPEDACEKVIPTLLQVLAEGLLNTLFGLHLVSKKVGASRTISLVLRIVEAMVESFASSLFQSGKMLLRFLIA